MCRYAMYGPYKDNYACFECRKVFRQTAALELSEHESENRHYRCPQCGETMNDMGHVLKRRSRRIWNIGKKLNCCADTDTRIIHAAATVRDTGLRLWRIRQSRNGGTEL